jgi:hypothetical protein
MKNKNMVMQLLRDQAYQTNDMLSSYILLHNKIIKNTSSLKSLFKKVDFEGPYEESKEMFLLCVKKKEELYELQNKIQKTHSKEEKTYLGQLIHLAEKISKASELLVKRQKMHFLKSKGDSTEWQRFSALQKEYKNAIQECMAEKEKLNQLGHLVS